MSFPVLHHHHHHPIIRRYIIQVADRASWNKLQTSEIPLELKWCVFVRNFLTY
jgi:hypothetical protein